MRFKYNVSALPWLMMGLVVFTGCQSIKKAPNRDPRVTTPATPAVPTPTVQTPPVAQALDEDVNPPPSSEPQFPRDEVPVVKPPAEKPRIAVILGPGGIRAFAHAGVLQEIHRTQLPIQFIAGLEMGALPAGLYASKPQAFEADWQLNKLKDDDLVNRSLMGGSQPVDLKDWRGYFQTVFGTAKVDDAKIPFACLTFQNEKQQILILNKGTFVQAMPFCLSYPPLFKSFEGHQAAASQLTVLAKYLRQKGATHIIYVDVLGDRGRLLPARGDENMNLIWNLTQGHLTSQLAQVDDILRIPLSDEITSFAKRRDMIKQGKETAAKALKPILKKYGLD